MSNNAAIKTVQGAQGAQGSPGATGPQGPAGTGGSGGGVGATYASTASAGIIQLAGDLAGLNSTATTPRISSISGDGSNAVQVPSGTILYFGGSLASVAPSGLIRLPMAPISATGIDVDLPIITTINASGAYSELISYGNDSGRDELIIGDDANLSLLKLESVNQIVMQMGGVQDINALTFGRDPASNLPYLGINAGTGMVSFQVASGVASYMMKFPATLGASGNMLSTDSFGNLYWQSGGMQGSPGVTGPQGPAGTGGGGGAGATYASTASAGIIQLAGDLGGASSTATAPRISSLGGNASNQVVVASGVALYSNKNLLYVASGNASGMAFTFSDGVNNVFNIATNTGTSELWGSLSVNKSFAPTFITYPQNSFTVLDNSNDFLQAYIQNFSSGNQASTDYIATADNGTNSTYYVDLGINSSTFPLVPGNVGGPNDSYLYASNRRLLLGTLESTATGVISFFTGSGGIEQLRIYNDGGVQVGGTFIASPGTGVILAQNALAVRGGSGVMAQLVAAGGTSYNMIWPNAIGPSGTILTTNGSGVLSWTTGITGPTGPQGPAGTNGSGGGGAGGTYASAATAGLIQLAGDLAGKSSTATAPYISSLQGNTSGMVNIPSGTRLLFGGNLPSSTSTGLIRLPMAGYSGAVPVTEPIMSYNNVGDGFNTNILTYGYNLNGKGQVRVNDYQTAAQELLMGHNGYFTILKGDSTLSLYLDASVSTQQNLHLPMTNIQIGSALYVEDVTNPLLYITARQTNIATSDFQILAQAPNASATANSQIPGNINLAIPPVVGTQQQYGKVNFIHGSSGGYTLMAQISRANTTGQPYFGLQGAGASAGMMTFQVASGGGSFMLRWPNAIGATGTVLTTDNSGNLSWVAPVGAQGPTGVAGPQGSPGATGAAGQAGSQGASSVWILNAGATLGQFNTINLVGALIGTTGPGQFGATINSISDIYGAGISGSLGVTGALWVPSGSSLIQWTNPRIALNRGTIGFTSVGTAAAYATINETNNYEVKYNICFTGLASGVTVQVMQYLSATGIYGSGTPVADSLAYYNSYTSIVAGQSANSVSVSNSYMVSLPSGTNISTDVRYIRGGAPSGSQTGTYKGIMLSPTGTMFMMRSI